MLKSHTYELKKKVVRNSQFSLRCPLVLIVSLLGRVPTLRLIGSAWPERQRGNCWKTRVAGFLPVISAHSPF